MSHWAYEGIPSMLRLAGTVSLQALSAEVVTPTSSDSSAWAQAKCSPEQSSQLKRVCASFMDVSSPLSAAAALHSVVPYVHSSRVQRCPFRHQWAATRLILRSVPRGARGGPLEAISCGFCPEGGFRPRSGRCAIQEYCSVR